MTAKFVGVTGLPRAGSTLLCQLLAQHPEIHCEGHSSPLCNTLLGIRRMVSDDTFFLSQLDHSFETSYSHLTTAMRGFCRGWYGDINKKVVVDKNRAWLHAVELLLQLEPDARLIVCLRELGQIYGSIEAQHQRTILVDFIDHLADYDPTGALLVPQQEPRATLPRRPPPVRGMPRTGETRSGQFTSYENRTT